MLYTLTTNPAIDMNLVTAGVEPKKVNRTLETVYSPNGKGVNVSLVLKHYGVDSVILGFFGGFSGRYIIEEVEKIGVASIPTWIEGDTRINVFLNDGKDEYKFVNSGCYVERSYQESLLALVESADEMEHLSISGSLAPGIDPNYYEEILKVCEKKGVKVILDISSPKLRDLLAYKPYLIKPNDEELEEIFGLKIKNEIDVKKAFDYLHERGAQNILLTLGEKGSYFSNGDDIYFASTQKIELVSSACAGDSALGAFLSIWLQDTTNIEKALKYSAATGANVAESNGIGDLKKVETYVNHIKIRKGI